MTTVHGKTVLIVDDEADLREILIDEAEAAGYHVLNAENGTQAFAILSDPAQRNRIDAVLSDINMPQMDGLTLLSKVRGIGLEMPFLFLTGYGDKEKAIEALKLGAFDFLEKPCNLKFLMTRLNQAAELGMALRTVEDELETICNTMTLTPEALNKFRVAQKALLRMKKTVRTTDKKSA